MAFYIWLNKEGKETKREAKGRGRPKADAVPREDGNFYIQESKTDKEIVKKEPKKEIVTAVIGETKVVEKEVEPEKQRRTKKLSTTRKIKVSEFISKLFYSASDFIRDGDKISIRCPNTYEIDVGFIKPYSVYTSFVIDIKENTISVWILDPKGNPSFVVNEAFLPE
jgi:hypothetical protein